MSGSRLAELEAAVGRNVSRETFDRLAAFEAEFVRWAGRINLVAPSTLPHIWRRHIIDSAQLLSLAPDATSWLDLGSGGGFPGAVLAVLLAERPGGRIRLVESNNKKAAFLRTVLGSLGAPAQVETARIESCNARGEAFEIVTARALASLDMMLGLSETWLSAGATGLFHKGRDYKREIEESRDAWDYDLIEHPSVVDPESIVLGIRGLRRKQ